MAYRVIIGSTIYYAKDIEAESDSDALVKAHEALKDGAFTEWREVEVDSFVYDVLQHKGEVE